MSTKQKTYDIRRFLDRVLNEVNSHQLGEPGAYARWNQHPSKKGKDTAINPYGCADAANILYTINQFPGKNEERSTWVAALNGLQNPDTGLFNEPTHHPIHTTAHCIAALELFDALPSHPLTALEHLCQPQAMLAFLDNLDWHNDPWSAAHQGAGLYAALILTDSVSFEWQQDYFNWLWQQTDPQTGLLRKNCIAPISRPEAASIFPHLAGTFHYLFNIQYARQPMRYPERLIDTCLDIFNRNEYPLGKIISFPEIDWIYCLNRALRQSGYRYADCQTALHTLAAEYIPYLERASQEGDAYFGDLHMLFGALCALAELQTALPGVIITAKPLRLVLDRRPFI